ncbi:MAG: hypothetical protein ACKO2L_21200 [Planctomycetaceae bacterium]
MPEKSRLSSSRTLRWNFSGTRVTAFHVERHRSQFFAEILRRLQ